jgi:hypothetical protein
VNDRTINNIISALKRRDRISNIAIADVNDSELKNKLAPAMLEPFPALRDFYLSSLCTDASLPLPESLLSGSAPSLQICTLSGIPFPTFPKFVLSATQLNTLNLREMPNSGFISPQSMAACLSSLPNLGSFSIELDPPQSRRDRTRTHPPPLTRAALPLLTNLSFIGTNRYFENLVAHIDAPLLNQLIVTFFMDAKLDIPQLHDFVDRTETLQPFNKGSIVFSGRVVKVIFESPASSARFELEIKCGRPDWQLPSMMRVFRQPWPILSHLEHLELHEISGSSRMNWEYESDMDSAQWLEVFRRFIAVQRLYVSKRLVPPVAATLREFTGGSSMDVLPVLHELSTEGHHPSGPVREVIKSFVAARRLSGHSLVIQAWEARQSPTIFESESSYDSDDY